MIYNKEKALWYKNLCEKCDYVLQNNLSIERVSISSLHVLNEHPSNLSKYSHLFNKGKGRRIKESFKSALIQIKELLSFYYKKERNNNEPLTETNVVFISHLLNKEQIGKEDFYFGNLPETLKKEGFSTNVILTNNIRFNISNVKLWDHQMAGRVILKKILNFKEEINLRFRLSKELKVLTKELNKTKESNLKKVYQFAIDEVLSSRSIASLRFYIQFKQLFKILRPKVLILTYEGHSWERLAFAAAREIIPEVKCIGYHHTINFPLQHASNRLLGNNFDPDIVLTAGDISKNQFQKYFNQNLVKVKTLGIHRRVINKDVNSIRFNESSTCLVVPDGIISEVLILFNFVISAAKNNPNIKYIFRLHPAVSLQSLKKSYPEFNELPFNFIFSNNSLQDDINTSRWVLYRGSNAAVYSVIFGLRPFYLEMDGELTIDSLSNLNTWKKKVKNIEQFIKFALKDLTISDSDLYQESIDAINYCNSYFLPLNNNVLLEELR
jgi:hypothetical protein